MAKKVPDINLIKTGKIDIIDQLIKWAINIGRIVIIVVEVIALSAFLYRFSLDRELIDLHSKIKQEQAIVDFFKENEDTYRNLQDRLLTASTFSEQASKKTKIFNDIITFTPSGIIFNDLSVYEERIRITASTNSIIALSSFVETLKDYPLIESISVDKIENKPSTSLISFGISATLKKDKVVKTTK